MSAYSTVVFLHSWLRWAVLGLAVAVVARSVLGAREARAWSPVDERLHSGLVNLANLQLVVGLILYFALSPIVSVFLSAPGPSMKDAGIRFFAVEHGFGMIAALGLLHVGRARSKRAEGAVRHKRVWTFVIAALIVTVLSIPWPFSRVAKRPLLRGIASTTPEIAPRT